MFSHCAVNSGTVGVGMGMEGGGVGVGLGDGEGVGEGVGDGAPGDWYSIMKPVTLPGVVENEKLLMAFMSAFICLVAPSSKVKV